MGIKISILIPTRHRSSRLKELINSVVENTKDLSRIEIILRIDEDDHTYDEIITKEIQILKIVGKPSSMGTYLTECLSISSGDIIFVLNDDVVIKTPDWDEIVISIHNRYSDGIYLAYGNDLFKKEKLCTFPILSRTTCEFLQNPFPAIFLRGFIDTHLMDIFTRLRAKGVNRLIYDSNLRFEHMHWRAGKSIIDSTYSKGRALRFSDDKNYLRMNALREYLACCLLAKIKQKPNFSNFSQSEIIFSEYCLIRYYQIIKLIFGDKGVSVNQKIHQIFYFILRDIVEGIYKKFRIT